MPPIRIGFDLDGVLLYNPARIFRPITTKLKSILKTNSNKNTNFYYPESKIEQFIWKLVHYSSLFIAEGFEDIATLSTNKKIEPYIVTSRYDCLKEDFERWLKIMDAPSIFKGTFHNSQNLQPHVFKEEKIRELKLEYFVEDNWDITKHLNKNTKAKVLWISNSLDRTIDYDLKFMNLKDATSYLKNKVENGK